MINKKPLINFIIWTFTLFLLCIIGASNVLAVSINSTDYATKYYYGNANNTTTTSTEYRTGSNNKVTLFPADAPTYDNAETFTGFYNRINYTISKGSIYTLSLAVSYSNLQTSEWGETNVTNRLLSSDFAHCSDCSITAVSGSIRRYANTSGSGNTYDYVVQMNYTFVATNNASTWYIGTYTGDDRTLGISNHLYTSIVMVNNLDISNDNSSTIINQNDTIIDQNQQMIDQNQQNTQDIINNNNNNADKIIEENKKNFNDCRNSVNLFNPNNLEQGWINTSGDVVSNSNRTRFKDYIEVKNSTEYYLSSLGITSSENWWVHFYDENKQHISYYSSTQMIGSNNIFTTPNNCKYIRASIAVQNTNISNVMLAKSSSVIDYEPFGEEICVNKLDEQKNAINNVDNTLKDDSVDDNGVADAFESFNDYLDDNSTITQLITLPITLYTAILNNLNGTCSPFNLGELYGQSLILPCINISQYLGNSLWTMIDIIISGFAIYAISKKMIKVFNNFSSLREGDVIDD